MPQVRSSKISTRYVISNLGPQLVHEPTTFSFNDLTFQLTVPAGGFLVIGPGVGCEKPRDRRPSFPDPQARGRRIRNAAGADAGSHRQAVAARCGDADPGPHETMNDDTTSQSEASPAGQAEAQSPCPRDDGFYRLLYEHSPVATIATDREFTVLTCNASAGKLLGQPIEQIIGRPLAEAVPPARRKLLTRAARAHGRATRHQRVRGAAHLAGRQDAGPDGRSLADTGRRRGCPRRGGVDRRRDGPQAAGRATGPGREDGLAGHAGRRRGAPLQQHPRRRGHVRGLRPDQRRPPGHAACASDDRRGRRHAPAESPSRC